MKLASGKVAFCLACDLANVVSKVGYPSKKVAPTNIYQVIQSFISIATYKTYNNFVSWSKVCICIIQ
ncbi:hypothetical protein A4D02_06595 [Niastella koreensis]|uniref:Uncharacterized protein n=1 Tax=Niastella koreensis TaxID=354356 RepID=A0ABX3NVX2_9BACT|nr:hypothetical protein A4D02_06595 [Niastella koreensis]